MLKSSTIEEDIGNLLSRIFKKKRWKKNFN